MHAYLVQYSVAFTDGRGLSTPSWLRQGEAIPPLKMTGSLDWRTVRCAGKHFSRCDHRVAVDRDRVLHFSRVAAGVSHHHRNISRLGHAEYQFIASLEPFKASSASPPSWSSRYGIGARDVADQFRLELAQAGTERIVEPGQVVVVADPVGQVHINRGMRLPRRVVVVLVQGDGETHRRRALDASFPATGGRIYSGSRVEGSGSLGVRVPAKIAAVPLPW